ncbi:MAG TPA: SDR family oxidoreductase [Actinomycetota bacterium]|nr:SDR family oxidoreductase [Actinomycetota bacterium]
MAGADPVWVVTGASSGIGRRTALDLAEEGARVCAVARRETLLRALVDEMGGAAAGHSWVECDVSNRDDVRRLAAHVEEVHGRCDVLVNNAGVGSGAWRARDPVAEVRRVMETNFFGAVHCTAELLALLESTAPSCVVNVASIAGRVPVPRAASYSASKFALVGWSESLWFELAPRGVNVCVIEPGPLATEGFPMEALRRHPVLRFVLTDTERVSRAIRSAVRTRSVSRTAPRWYAAFPIARTLAPGAFRSAQRHLARRSLP